MTQPACVLLACAGPGPGDDAVRFAETHFDVRLVARYSDPDTRGLPPELDDLVREESIDFLFSFLSPVIVPSSILDRVPTAINFHPAPPKWPGIGGSCYALYDGDPTFGVTAHFMAPRVDSGTILGVREFPILATDSQPSLLERARHTSLSLYYDVLTELITTGSVAPSGHTWCGPPHTARELHRWLTLRPDSPAEEVDRKVRAGRHPNFPSPIVVLHGHRFGYLPP
jgi:methionyl-tRNA formyltransferase